MNSDKIIVTTPMIIEAHAAHGNDFLIPDIDGKIRTHETYSQYIGINFKAADGKVAGIRYIKLTGKGIVLGSRIQKPADRRFESIRFGIKSEDDNENTIALAIFCTAYEQVMEKLKSEGVFTDDEKKQRKQPNGTVRPVYLINQKIVSPMQTTTTDKNGDYKELENPFFWLSLSKKRFYNDNETKHVPTHFEEKYYLTPKGVEDTSPSRKAIMSHEYAPKFYNVDDFYHHPKTGKKIFKRLGAVQENGRDVELLNTNIQDYLTKGTAVMGNLKVEIQTSAKQCKLDISFYGSCMVRVAEASEEYGDGLDEADVESFNKERGAKLTAAGDDEIPDGEEYGEF